LVETENAVKKYTDTLNFEDIQSALLEAGVSEKFIELLNSEIAPFLQKTPDETNVKECRER